MDSIRWIGVAALVTVLVVLVIFLRDPHRTALPVGSTDLKPLEAKLAKLKPEERELVEEYVQRSHGDVLPPRFADPDNPFTARTFDDAIVLERKWRAKQKVAQAAVDARAADRAREFAPLRAVVSASVIRRELLSHADLAARRNGTAEASGSGAKEAVPGDADVVFVATVQLDDLEDSDILELKGAVMATDRDSPLPFQVCWVDIDEREFVPVRGRREVICANPNRLADAQQRAFVDDPPGRFSVTWEPRHLRLRDGTVLDAPER